MTNSEALAPVEPGTPRLELIPASRVKARRIEWWWKGRIARGKLSGIAGDPGVGKGTLGIDIAAHLSRGRDWPDGSPCEPGVVALLTGEDDPEDTIRPRLDVANADPDRVHLIGRITDPTTGEKRRIALDSDVDLLFAELASAGVNVVVIDPLSSYLGDNVNSWRDADMRRILDPLAEAAARHGIAVLIVGHLNKATGGKAMYRLNGSIANVAVVRMAFLVARMPEDPDRLALACVKANIARRPPTLLFRLATIIHPITQDEVGAVEWAGTSALTADDLVGPAPKADKLEAAKAFLLEYLASGPVASGTVKAAAKDAGIGRDPLWEAKGELAVRALKRGHDGWDWSLPPESNHPDASTKSEAYGSDPDGSVRFNTNPCPSPPVSSKARILPLEGSEPYGSVRPYGIPRALAHETCTSCGGPMSAAWPSSPARCLRGCK